MNIWAWVEARCDRLREQGHERLADIIDELPSAVCDMNHERAENLVSEGLASARELEDGWVEIFLRHWLMQSRVFHRGQGRPSLQACVSLLELTARKDNRECPQAICAVQDFAGCYARADGPGYAEERLAVTRETLARIDTSWPCWQCIGVEHTDALEDQGRFDDSLAFNEELRQKALAAGDSYGDLGHARAQTFLRMSRPEEALALLDELGPYEAGGAAAEVNWQLMRADALSQLDRNEEALACLPGADKVEGRKELTWLQTRRRIGDLKDTEAAKLEAHGFRFMAHARRDGADHVGTQLGLLTARCAIDRKLQHSARLALEAAAEFRTRLRKPELFDEEVAELEHAVAELPEVTIADEVTPDALRAELADDDFNSYELLCAARGRWPQNEGLLCSWAEFVGELGLHERGEGALRAFIAAQDEAPEATMQLGYLLRDAGDHARLLEFVDAHIRKDRPQHAWLLASSHERAGRLQEAAAAYSQAYTLKPDSDFLGSELLRVQLRLKAWPEALKLASALAESQEEPGSFDYDVMTAATALGDWAAVRRACARLGMELANEEGPIDEAWSYCRIESRSGGSSKRLWAVRTGPVTARLTAISSPNEAQQRHRDLVLFDPAPVSEDIDDDGDKVITFRELECLEAGERQAFVVDGVHPGDQALKKLHEALAELDVILQQRSGDGYQLEVPGAEPSEQQGYYGYLSVASDANLDELHTLLKTHADTWTHPLVWPGLVRKLGDDAQAELARQLAIFEELQL